MSLDFKYPLIQQVLFRDKEHLQKIILEFNDFEKCAIIYEAFNGEGDYSPKHFY